MNTMQLLYMLSPSIRIIRIIQILYYVNSKHLDSIIYAYGACLYLGYIISQPMRVGSTGRNIVVRERMENIWIFLAVFVETIA